MTIRYKIVKKGFLWIYELGFFGKFSSLLTPSYRPVVIGPHPWVLLPWYHFSIVNCPDENLLRADRSQLPNSQENNPDVSLENESWEMLQPNVYLISL